MLKNKVAFVIGGGGGIGSALSLRLAQEGASVAVADLNEPSASEVAKKITQSGFQSIHLGMDVTTRASVSSGFERVMKRFGRMDILVNTFGVMTRATVTEMTDSEWAKTIGINLTGVFLCCQAACPTMISQKYGRIINLSSGLAFKGKGAFSHYSASKGGVTSFTKSLAQELAPFGITVNAIAPGPVDTDMVRKGLSPEEIAFSEKTCPLGRLAVPEDLTDLVTFLAGEGSRFITGQCIHVNGGFYMP